MNDLVKSLLHLALAWSGYGEPGHLPAIRVVTSEDMPCPCKGVFLYAQAYSGYDGIGTRGPSLLPRDDVDLATSYGKSILLHELVHLLQAQEGATVYGSRQWHGREREAYRIQYRYLRSMGLTYLEASFPELANLPDQWNRDWSRTIPPRSGANPNHDGLISDARSRRTE